jgi:hypothetical protein
MPTDHPPAFDAIAGDETKAAFISRRPELVSWLDKGTKLFKWTQSITTSRGVSPWWQFLTAHVLPNGEVCPGIRELQERARNTGSHDRDFARAQAAVTLNWNKMTSPVAIEMTDGAWGYIGRAAGQLRDKSDPGVFFIGGGYQVWIPDISIHIIKQIALVPYLEPNMHFNPR